MIKAGVSLDEVFRKLSGQSQFQDWTKTRIAKITLGSSVIRAFAIGSKEGLLKELIKIEVDSLLNVSSQKEYDNWHVKKVNKVYSSLARNKKNIKRHTEKGLKWGHSAKIWNIYIGLLIFYSHYFKPYKKLDTIKFYLHVPLDKKVFDALRKCGIKQVPQSIKSVEKEKYLEIQKLLNVASSKHKLPAFYFDEYAWSFDNNKIRHGQSHS